MMPYRRHLNSQLTVNKSWLVVVMGLSIAQLVFTGCKAKSDMPRSSPDSRTSSPIPSDKTSNKSPAELPRSLPPPLVELCSVPALDGLKYRNGEEAGQSSILESLGGGAGIADVDNDSYPDIIFPSGGSLAAPDKIFGSATHLVRNLGRDGFVDTSRAARIDMALAYTHGVANADFDNDGYIDCLITGYGRLQLYRNQGDGSFIEMALACGLTDSRWSSSAAWCDVNRDGMLDLYVCHYVNWSFANHPYCAGPDADHREICSPKDFEGVDDVLYINRGAGQFVDGSRDWGLVAKGKGLGVVAGDVDRDGLPDIYVANDTTENFFYRNLGNRLEEVAQAAGVAYDDEGIPNGSMGVDLADFNGDQQPDLWAANYERESFALYRNEGSGLFLHVSRPTGVTALGGLFVGFGTAFVDADGDGDLDVFVSNGHVIKYPQFSQRQQLPLLLENKNNRFSKVAFANDHYFSNKHEGRGLAVGDLNSDGHLDLVISHENSSPALLNSTLGSAHRSLVVHLVGTNSNRTAIGAQVTLQHAQGKLQRLLNGGGSYLSSHQPILVFEIPNHWQTEQLTVRWPSGKTQEVKLDASVAGIMQIVEQQN